ncbi:hypothetical protein Bb109J_c2537 [Bdellovibrio bacteriovorus]|uniref:type II secretion system protein n=1 Tax=Bdellovibrio bacteriovorus TaxID=959 RepID=UPI00045BF6B2|nr:hypothetical protein [Bdellovibrio bacteriovorus]AHZ85225.1 hypothetical protein EP01_09785 [Bdellovibrio bacteriovorus]BEV69117.1 hypothetical protein Bb109J_c2537 [Bdellovibrio bacteriovorus]
MMKVASNQKGMSILEVLLGLAMITLVGSFFISGILSMKKVAMDSGTKNSLYKQINDVIENIRPNVRMYQINYFTTDKERENALNPGDLPMAWGNGMMSTAKDCPGCPGRYGFVIQAYPGMKGLYLVTVRLTHRDWAQGEKAAVAGDAKSYGYVDYQFVVNSQ